MIDASARQSDCRLPDGATKEDSMAKILSNLLGRKIRARLPWIWFGRSVGITRYDEPLPTDTAKIVAVYVDNENHVMVSAVNSQGESQEFLLSCVTLLD
jgi:hypothetical protein